MEMEKMRRPCPADDVDAATTAPPSPGPWAELPVGILAKILWRINPNTDFTNFTSVCKAWRDAAADDPLPLKHQMPWLLLTEEDYPGSGGGQTRSFYSLSEHKIHELPLPEACRRRYVGCTDGWLVTLREAVEGEEMHILNPISRIRIPLPSQSTLLLPPEDDTFPEELIAQNRILGYLGGEPNGDGEEEYYDSGEEDDYGDDDYDDEDYDDEDEDDYDDEDYDDNEENELAGGDDDEEEEEEEQEEEGQTEERRTVRERYQSFIKKVVLSCSPAKKGSDCVALAIYGWSDNKLAYARPGDAAWTILSWDWKQFTNKWGPFEDAVYYKDQFYVVNCHGTVMRCSIPPVGSAEEPLAEVIAFGIPYDGLIWGNCTYLVEHQGSLLQVLRKRRASKKSRPDKPLPEYLTFGFHVFRLDPSSGAWEMIDSLGDGALFLGMNTSVSVSATDLRRCKRNCIYFTDGDERWYNIALGGRGAGRDTGYCTLKDWQVHYLDKVASCSPFSPPIWVLPSASEA